MTAVVRFDLVHHFPVSVDDVAAALLDPEFQSSLSDIGALKERTVVSERHEGNGRVVREIRCVLALKVSGAAKSFLGDSEPAWIQEETWDPGSRTWTWVVRPEVAKELLTAHGSTLVRGDDTKAERVVTGEVKV
ncbi:MAG: DUF2505 domain-containing protein, partial [Actinomycetota bacterium]|nr:DUF2505 domain-containing protein [Actinomycetota bacterium]